MKQVPRKRLSTRKQSSVKERTPESGKPDIKALATSLQLMYQRELEQRDKFRAFVRQNRRLPCVERAEAWLRFVASEPENYGDQEAVVYLVSRGQDCVSFIQQTKERWLEDERGEIEACCRGVGVSEMGRKTKYLGGMSRAEAKRITERSVYELRNFWRPYRAQELTIDATMLRTVQWCGIGGFESWWKRLARETISDFTESGLDKGVAVYWLFAMCRSDLAIKLMSKAMRLALDNVEMARGSAQPWDNSAPVALKPKTHNQYIYKELEDLTLAATLLFANHIIRNTSERDSELLNAAAGLLQKYQKKDGSWPYWSIDKNGSIEATAMAIHALVYHQPPGWRTNLAAACTWIESKQEEGGYWVENSSPDPTYLTVLVLDALELARGGLKVTFGRGNAADLPPSSRSNRKYRVALSFPGEARSIVQPVADILRRRLGDGRVFYDNYFKHLLARPDLDLFIQSVYHDESDLLVVWISRDYAQKEWCCNVEWPAIRDIIKQRRGDDVMFLRLDDANLKGVLSNYGYIDVRAESAEEIAALILKRLEERNNP